MKCSILSLYFSFSVVDALSITAEDRELICNGPYPELQGDRKKIRWLHLPKTGTSFANTIWHYGCPEIPSSASVADYNRHFEGELDARYPIEKNCPYLVDHTPATHKPIGEKEWKDHYGSFVSMFREPSSRIESAFHYQKHCIEDCNPENNKMWECDTVREKARLGKACASLKSSKCVEEYALAEPAQGCQTKMVYGVPCSGNITMDPTKRKLAAQRVSKGFAFVGLVEEWDLSLCLFHRILGGTPLRVERDSVRVASKSEGQDRCSAEVKARLGDDKDPVDKMVYSAAKEKFEQQVANVLALIKKEQAALLARDDKTPGPISRHVGI